VIVVALFVLADQRFALTLPNRCRMVRAILRPPETLA
jgi:hypothetical protein